MPQSRNDALRNEMVETQIVARGIKDRRVLDAMRKVPREMFLPEEAADRAFADGAVGIGQDQTISQPYIVALMTEAAGLTPQCHVLDVGTGSGYGAAVAAQLADQVFTIERIPELADAARKRFHDLHYDNIHSRVGDGSQGWPEQAPFDAILVAAAASVVPEALCAQLKIGGRLVIPIGSGGGQRLMRIERSTAHGFRETDLGPVAFVPLLGDYGPQAGKVDRGTGGYNH
ncbi:protein-L-isoaspartate(D-aspartate) O-methyltransferase [Telmatospirillum sp. J64-1]|uniref:protein-L-isoaspartate(D-aspartate) O-methyltransferase n=1 Tax=Telmatospirillum sp. J64-1 TaxID=2502183 RepID=UPI002103F4DE|nr:protein-L-isoaspartate(D-aspartate) O-methyltransferase [Telmatospirillum sp. J64-1]